MFHQYGQQLAERDSELNDLVKVDLGGGLFSKPGYINIDVENADIIHDLNEGIPLPDNSVGVINANHVLAHLKDPIKTMSEIYRVLCDGVGHLLRFLLLMVEEHFKTQHMSAIGIKIVFGIIPEQTKHNLLKILLLNFKNLDWKLIGGMIILQSQQHGYVL